MGWLRSIFLGLALLVSSASQGAAAELKRVLLLHSFGPQFAPWDVVAARFKAELVSQSPIAIDIYEHSLDTARLTEPPDERAYVDYLRSLFATRKLDLMVALGAPAAQFFQRHRAELSPSTPLLITGIEQRNVREKLLGALDATVVVRFDTSEFIEHILRLLPDTTTIAVVIGASPVEKFWVGEMRRDFKKFEGRVQFEWLNELPLKELLGRVASMGPRTVLFYGTVRVDGAGVPHENDRVLSQLRAATNVPIFGYVDNDLGKGIVGGPLLSAHGLARQAAAVSIRIFRGDAPSSIVTPPLRLESPEYDWGNCNALKSVNPSCLQAVSFATGNPPCGNVTEHYSSPFLRPFFFKQA